MKLFPKSFFALFLAIMLFSTGSAMAVVTSVVAITVTTSSDCGDTGVCNVDLTCPSSPNNAIGYRINGGTLAACASANLDLKPTCKPECVSKRDTLTTAAAAAAAAAYKAKLDPMGDATYNVQDQTFSRAMCQALKVVTGSAGKTFAAFAIIATGIGFFTGKVSWGLMIGVTAGIATMFGAPSIVAAISGQDTEMRCSNITR